VQRALSQCLTAASAAANIVTVVTTSDLTDRLRTLDLNEYEGRLYLALLGTDALTAYELGKRASIPLSRCYEVARSLARKGLALTVPGETPRYRAADPTVAIERHRRDLDRLAADLAERAAARDDREPVWTVEGRATILATARASIQSARARVTLFARSDVAADLAADLAAARARGVAIATHPAAALALLVDDAEALLGELEPTDRALATHLRQPTVVAWLTALVADGPTPTDDAGSEAAWLDWESSKVRRLLASVPGLTHLDAD
jgi:hypothetical protein